MNRRIVTMVIATTIIVSLLIAVDTSTVLAEIPRISFLDPHSECDTLEQFNNYWQQMDSCGFTHNVGYGDEFSFNNSANIFMGGLTRWPINILKASGTVTRRHLKMVKLPI